MTDAANDQSTDGQPVRFEERLSMTDSAGAERLVTGTRVLALVMIVVTVGAIAWVGSGIATRFLSMLGGTDAALSVLERTLAERPLLIAGLLLVGLLTAGYVVFSILGLVRQLGSAFDGEVHVRVTDAGVSVQRSDSRYWQSSGVEIPFDAISAVEYVDPERSSTRLEHGDWRSKQFFGGRSRSWVRLERGGKPTVYVGSDRPRELAETIARRVPGIERAEPF